PGPTTGVWTPSRRAGSGTARRWARCGSSRTPTATPASGTEPAWPGGVRTAGPSARRGLQRHAATTVVAPCRWRPLSAGARSAPAARAGERDSDDRAALLARLPRVLREAAGDRDEDP